MRRRIESLEDRIERALAQLDDHERRIRAVPQAVRERAGQYSVFSSTDTTDPNYTPPDPSLPPFVDNAIYFRVVDPGVNPVPDFAYQVRAGNSSLYPVLTRGVASSDGVGRFFAPAGTYYVQSDGLDYTKGTGAYASTYFVSNRAAVGGLYLNATASSAFQTLSAIANSPWNEWLAATCGRIYWLTGATLTDLWGNGSPQPYDNFSDAGLPTGLPQYTSLRVRITASGTVANKVFGAPFSGSYYIYYTFGWNFNNFGHDDLKVTGFINAANSSGGILPLTTGDDTGPGSGTTSRTSSTIATAISSCTRPITLSFTMTSPGSPTPTFTTLAYNGGSNVVTVTEG